MPNTHPGSRSLFERLAPRFAYNRLLLAASASADYFGVAAAHARVKGLRRLIPVRGFGGRARIPTIESPSTTLRRDDEITAAVAQLVRLELPPHVDRAKNWDAFRAFSFLLEHGRKDQAVVDLGSSTYGVLLSW